MKRVWLFGLLTVLSSTFVSASILDNVFGKIIGIGNLGFLGISPEATIIGLTRLLIGLLVFTILFAVIVSMGGDDKGKGKGTLSFLNRGQGGAVAAIVAIITAIFLPSSVLLAIGASYATAVSLILIGVPVVGLAYILWMIPGEGEDETKFTVVLKIILCGILLWILTAVKYHIGVLV